MTFAQPISALAAAEEEAVEISAPAVAQAVVITMNGHNIRVQNASGQVLEIYNVTGVRVFAAKIDTNDKSWNLNLSRGCYIVKVGETVRKVSIPG